MRPAVVIGILLMAGLALASTADELKFEAQVNNAREDAVRKLMNKISETERAAIGVQLYVKYTNAATDLSFIRAGDKIFIKHPTNGRFFMKTTDFWGGIITPESIITLQEKCPFPPHIAPKEPECPKNAATCPPKEEKQCDKKLADMKKFAHNGLLTKKKFHCLEKYLKPKKPTLSYFCVINGVRKMLPKTKAPKRARRRPKFATKRRPTFRKRKGSLF